MKKQKDNPVKRDCLILAGLLTPQQIADLYQLSASQTAGEKLGRALKALPEIKTSSTGTLSDLRHLMARALTGM